MPIEIEDPKEEEKKAKAEAAEKKRKRAAAAAQEDDEFVGQKRELWPLIPAIPVVVAVLLSLLPERVEVNEVELERARCMAQMMDVVGMKTQVVQEKGLEEGDSLPEEEIEKIRQAVSCPGGGSFEIREAGSEPRCSLHGTMSEWGREQKNIAYWDKVLGDNKQE